MTRFETKIAVVLRDDLSTWQRLNATAFLISGLAGDRPELVGEPYEDADGAQYLPMFGQPVMIFEADLDTLRVAHARAVERGLRISIFTRELFETGNDMDNRNAVKAVASQDLDLVGICVHAGRNAVDRVVKGAHLHS